MQIELSKNEIIRILGSLSSKIEDLNRCLEKDTSDFRKIFEDAQKECNQLYDKLYTHLKEYKE